MDVQKKLDEIVAAVGGARSMPMSASCVINRAELLAQLEEVRQALPGSLAQAQELIGGREQMVEEARREAERIIDAAHNQRGSLISDTEIARRSQAEADRILEEARREAEEIRAEADDYVDSKLANFEVVLSKTIGSVDRGREKLLGRGPGLDEHGYPDMDAPERSHDPETQRQQADAYVDTKLATFEAVLSKTLEAVGRGRQKLLGRVPSDDLGVHMAAQDAAGASSPAPRATRTSWRAWRNRSPSRCRRRSRRRRSPCTTRTPTSSPPRSSRTRTATRIRTAATRSSSRTRTPPTSSSSSPTPMPRTSSSRRPSSPRSTRPASSTRA